MSSNLKKWLKTQLEALVSVQRCTFAQTTSFIARAYEPDMIVYLWTGARVHIYVFTEPPKMRAIKTILQTDSELGIGSLFIVSAEILPTPNQTFKPDEWLLAIHALTNDRVYTYAEDRGLLQIHFEKVGLTDNYRAIYGSPVRIHQLRYARVTVKLYAVKGFWMLADFGAEPFWKRQAQDGSFYEVPAYKQTRTQERPPQQHTRHTPPPRQNHNRSNGSQAAPPKLEQAYELLGLPAGGATREEVKAAFRKLAFEVHPDVSKLEKGEAEARFKALSEAYEYIKSVNDW